VPDFLTVHDDGLTTVVDPDKPHKDQLRKLLSEAVDPR
jgi:hypothetical protein